MHIFPDIIHQFHAKYNPNLRAVMSPDQSVLFTIIVHLINEMIQLQPTLNLTRISIGELLEKSTKMSSSKLIYLSYFHG